MPTTVIVSSPHSLCSPLDKKRACDLAAGLAAQLLCRAIDKQSRKLRCVYLEGDEYRKNHDLNRKASRGTPYRKRLASVMDAVESARVLVDVHSFPNEYLDEAGDINFFKKGEAAPDIVFLEGPMDSFNGNSLSRVLWAACIEAGLSTKIITGITVNDIMNEASEHKIPAVLIEYNEKLLSSPDMLYEICILVAKVLVKMSA